MNPRNENKIDKTNYKLYVCGKTTCGPCNLLCKKLSDAKVEYQYRWCGFEFDQIVEATNAKMYPFAAIVDDSNPERLKVVEFFPNTTSAEVEQLIFRFTKAVK